ncbi:Type I phosphodiesterase/nucleotide pyrophosphatase (fragment) [Nostocoides australiense Ben110]|uniref:Type I phosphodiesterase/nucleotide pyrophosphatase n=1 Tax=Nostocoides australiense Ben110 TaxID=1193182 RepID=W6JZA3_9MICO
MAEAWRGRLAGRAVVLTREQAIDEGWFGPVARRNAGRIGDLVVAMGPRGAIEDSRTSKPILLQLLGMHGSVTRDEVAVPLLHRPAESD